MYLRAAMKQARMRPTTRSYNALLSACERAGQPDRALEVWANMQRARRNGDAQLLPTAVTYNTLLSTCGKAGRCAAHTPDRLARQRAECCVARKLMSWFPPCGAVLGLSCINKCHPSAAKHQLRCCRYEEAMGLYRGMRAAGLHADAYTLTALMTACERVGKWDTGAQLLSQLKAGGVAPNLHHHNCLLNAYGRAGRWEQVL